MDIEKKLAEIVDRLFLNTGATFSGIFIQDKPVISKTIYTDKKNQLEETLKLIIYKAHQINEFLPDFGEEYVYAEGDDISIFIYFVRPDIAIASIIEEKPKFALLKLEHTSVASKLKGMESQIDDYIKGVVPLAAAAAEPEPEVQEPEEQQPHQEEKITEQQPVETKAEEEHREKPEEFYEEIIIEEPEEQTEPEQPQELDETEKTEITAENMKDRFAEELEMIEKTEDLEELEKVLSETKEEEAPPLEELLKPEPVETHSLEDVIKTADNENPPLEELLKEESAHGEAVEETETPSIEEEIESLSEEMEYYDREVLTRIQQELLKEIGPVGKFLFKKRMKELNIDEDRITRTVLIKLIDELSNDIIDEKRKNRFVERVSAFL
ncbi:hypothetical protein [Persephonella sp.]